MRGALALQARSHFHRIDTKRVEFLGGTLPALLYQRSFNRKAVG
jgi:hypothetical protein